VKLTSLMRQRYADRAVSGTQLKGSETIETITQRGARSTTSASGNRERR
jgi:hypothetical protein